MAGHGAVMVEDYQRDIGLLCTSIPAILYVSMMFFSGAVSTYNIIWSIITFSPLIIIGGLLDVVLASRAFNWISIWWLRVIASWAVLFALARVVSISLLNMMYESGLSIDMPLLVLASVGFGAIYGFFFIMAYLYLLRLFKRPLARRARR